MTTSIYIYNPSNANLFPLPTANVFLPKDLDRRRGAQQRCSCSSTHPAGVSKGENPSPRAPFPQADKALMVSKGLFESPGLVRLNHYILTTWWLVPQPI